MGSLSNYAENKIIDHIFKTAAFTQPSNIYVALSTADPTDAGTGIAEPVGNNYSRVVCNAFNAASSRAADNTSDITFPQASGSWGTITHWALFDASTAGNMLVHGSFTLSKAIASGNIPKINAGDLDISVTSGGMSTALANKILDHLLKRTAFAVPTNIYVALSTSNPTDTGSGIAEPSGNGYARTVNNNWSTAANGATENGADIVFPTATGSWGNITHVALYDTISAGNFLMYSSVGVAQTITTDDIAQFSTGAIDITLD